MTRPSAAAKLAEIAVALMLALSAYLALGCASQVIVTTEKATVNAQVRTGMTLTVSPDGEINMGRVSAKGIVGAVVEGAVRGATRP